MANCKSCLHSIGTYRNGELKYLTCTHELHEGDMLIGDHECTEYQYEPGACDEPAKTEW